MCSTCKINFFALVSLELTLPQWQWILMGILYLAIRSSELAKPLPTHLLLHTSCVGSLWFDINPAELALLQWRWGLLDILCIAIGSAELAKIPPSLSVSTADIL